MPGGHINANFLGIELSNPGKLEEREGKYYTWYDDRNPWTGRVCKQPDGVYAAYTLEQLITLQETVVWFKKKFKDFEIIGHRDIQYDKSDPSSQINLKYLNNL